MIKKHLAGFGFIIFLAVAFIAAGAAYYKSSWANGSFLSGAAASAYEKEFDKNLPHQSASIQNWNTFGYVLFGEGKEGVLIGQKNWLFTNEEFSHVKNFEKNLEDNKSYVALTAKNLSQNNIKLMVVPIPSKARVYEEKLGRYEFPTYWKNQYDDFRSFLKSNNIANIDLLKLFNQQKENNIFLRTDTHWTPTGARLAAMLTEQAVNKKFPYLSWKKVDFKSTKGESTKYAGDLMRYTADIEKDQIDVWDTQSSEPINDSLFDDVALPITLVGTSYSANKQWNFEGFLKEMLGSDILNVSDEGLGPFTTMENYLKSNAYKRNKPKLILWEIPERYLAVAANK